MVAASYFEVVAAPAYEEGAVEILKGRKNLRIMELPGLGRLDELTQSAFLDIKSLADGGIVVQKSFVNRILTDADFLPAEATDKNGVTVTARKPNAQEMADLRFAWAVEAGVTSNSVIFARNGATVAIGTGEQDRVGCVELAIKAALDDIQARTQEARGGLPGTVLISDGFFPFRDGVDAAMAQGVTAIGQPGGSMRDTEVIAACNEASPQVAMVFTGQRSFKH